MTGPPPTQTRTERDPDLIIARAHLRLGSLALARAELETLAGRDRLDDEGVRDLAEARWRTGDTTGAGEAAATYLEVAPDDIVALVIAAEAQADLGRPAEARRLAGRALERADGSLDPVFAGMHRSSIWPVDPGTAGGPVGVLFDDLHPGPIGVDPAHARRSTDRDASTAEAPTHPPLDPAIPAAIHSGPGLWDDEVATGKGAMTAPVDAATLSGYSSSPAGPLVMPYCCDASRTPQHMPYADEESCEQRDEPSCVDVSKGLFEILMDLFGCRIPSERPPAMAPTGPGPTPYAAATC